MRASGRGRCRIQLGSLLRYCLSALFLSSGEIVCLGCCLLVWFAVPCLQCFLQSVALHCHPNIRTSHDFFEQMWTAFASNTQQNVPPFSAKRCCSEAGCVLGDSAVEMDNWQSETRSEMNTFHPFHLEISIRSKLSKHISCGLQVLLQRHAES